MNKTIIFLLIFVYSHGFSQKTSFGILVGTTRNFEIAKYITSSKPLSSEKTVDKGLNLSLGFYGECSINQKFKVGIEAKYLRIIQQSYQDSLGNPYFGGSNAVYECLNVASYYIHNINNNFTTSLGFFDTILIAYGTDLILPPKGTWGERLKVANNTFGVALKIGYNFDKLNVESGFMFPLTPTSESRSIFYYNPIIFIQLKYKFHSFKKITEKIKKKF